jgi:hypothetical protein
MLASLLSRKKEAMLQAEEQVSVHYRCKIIYHVPGLLVRFRIAERLKIDNNTKEEQAT